MNTKFICFCPNTGAVRSFIDFQKFNYSHKFPENELIEITDDYLLKFFDEKQHFSNDKTKLIEEIWLSLQKTKWIVDLDNMTLIKKIEEQNDVAAST